MKRFQRGFTAAELLIVVWICVLIAGVGGWIANVYKFVGMDFDHITGMLVVRAIGIIAAPLGAVMGFI